MIIIVLVVGLLVLPSALVLVARAWLAVFLAGVAATLRSHGWKP